MPPPPPKTVQAAVFIDSNGDAVIFPPVIIAAQNDDVDIVNAPLDDIVVIYPNDHRPAGALGARLNDLSPSADLCLI